MVEIIIESWAILGLVLIFVILGITYFFILVVRLFRRIFRKKEEGEIEETEISDDNKIRKIREELDRIKKVVSKEKEEIEEQQEEELEKEIEELKKKKQELEKENPKFEVEKIRRI